jgi:hypothetical protein
VFGQLIYYDFNEKQFKTFPHSTHKYDLDEQHLVTWIYKYRYQRFIQTSFFAEFLLCEQFCQVSFSSGLESEVAVAFDFLQHKFIESSSAMKKFRDFLRHHESATSTTHFCTGYILYRFYLQIQNLCVISEVEQQILLNQFSTIKQQFNTKNSTFYIPDYIQKCLGLENWDRESVCASKHIIVERLRDYWVPKYLLQVESDNIPKSQIALFSLAKKKLETKPINNGYPYTSPEFALEKDMRLCEKNSSDLKIEKKWAKRKYSDKNELDENSKKSKPKFSRFSTFIQNELDNKVSDQAYEDDFDENVDWDERKSVTDNYQ